MMRQVLTGIGRKDTVTYTHQMRILSDITIQILCMACQPRILVQLQDVWHHRK